MYFVNFFHRSLAVTSCTPVSKKRPVSVEDMILHQDNAPAYRAEDTQLTIQIQLGTEILNHPPYSPDLSPCNFALFPRLKRDLRGQGFDGLEDLRGVTQTSLASFIKGWYASTFIDWLHRHEKCIQAKGEYFKALWETTTMTLNSLIKRNVMFNVMNCAADIHMRVLEKLYFCYFLVSCYEIF